MNKKSRTTTQYTANDISKIIAEAEALKREKEELLNWQPRYLSREDYGKSSAELEDKSPAQVLIKFCEFGAKRNYNSMYARLSKNLKSNVSLEEFKQDMKLLDFTGFELLNFMQDEMVWAKATVRIDEYAVNFALICVGPSGEFEPLCTDKDSWVINGIE